MLIGSVARRPKKILEFELAPELRSQFSLDPRGFEALLALEGQVLRRVKNRRTLAFEREGRRYFIKIHRACGWRETVRNLLSLRLPVGGADHEWRALEKLRALGVPTMTLAGKGMRGGWPQSVDSFVITEEVRDSISLEDLLAQWDRLLPDQQGRLKRHLVVQLADSVRRMHEGGVNHRDLYLCHFLVREREWHRWTNDDPITPVMIDLHRAQIRPSVPTRWKIKDLGALLYSALEADMSSADAIRFIRGYLGPGWRERYLRERKFWYRVLNRALAFQREWTRMEAKAAQAGR